MLSRATSRPAATSAAIWSGPDVAGPRVQTIFARRPMSGAPSPVAASANPAPILGELPEPASGLYHYGFAGYAKRERARSVHQTCIQPKTVPVQVLLL